MWFLRLGSIQKAYVIHWVRLDRYSSAEEALSDGRNQLETLVSRVHDIITWVFYFSPICFLIDSTFQIKVKDDSFWWLNLISISAIIIVNFSPKLAAGSIKLHTHLFGPKLEMSNMTNEEYKRAVLQAKEHILAGDIFQIVLSQRFERRTFADPFEVYRALRIVNPSPYMTYLQVCQFLVIIILLVSLHSKVNLLKYILVSGQREYFGCVKSRNSYTGEEGNLVQ